MRRIKTILVAIKDSRGPAPATLKKAVQLAAGLNARLELFHAMTWPLYAEDDHSFQALKTQERDRVLRHLERLATRLRGRAGQKHQKITIAAEWDRPAYEAVVRRVSAIHADLVIAERHAGYNGSSAFLHFNDWELLRQSPVPVLIVKRAGVYKQPVVLSAVDPDRSKSKPARLDAQILALSRAVARALAGRVHTVHAYEVVYNSLHTSGSPDIKDFASMERRYLSSVKRRYRDLLRGSGVRSTERHLLNMPASEAIEVVAGKFDSQIVVLGAIARSGLKRLLLGNTAETVLDRLHCDLLIVKPPGFKTLVPRRPSGPRFVPLASLMVT